MPKWVLVARGALLALLPLVEPRSSAPSTALQPSWTESPPLTVLPAAKSFAPLSSAAPATSAHIGSWESKLDTLVSEWTKPAREAHERAVDQANLQRSFALGEVLRTEAHTLVGRPFGGNLTGQATTLVHGIAFDTGRLAYCSVCVDGLDHRGNPTPPNGKCDPWEPQARTQASGEYIITSPEFAYYLDPLGPTAVAEPPPLLEVNATQSNVLNGAVVLLEPGGDCIDLLSLTPVRARMVCATKVRQDKLGPIEAFAGRTCSSISDLTRRVQLQAGGSLDPRAASIQVSRALGLAPFAPLTTDPTSLSTTNIDNYHTLRVALALREMEVWEEMALSVLFPWQQPSGGVTLRGHSFREAVVGGMRNRTAVLVSTPSNASTCCVTALNFDSPDLFLSTVQAAATDALGLPALTSDERIKVLEVGGAASRLLALMQSNMPEDEATVDQDVWYRVQLALAQYQQVGIWLADETAQLASGGVSVVDFVAATSTDQLMQQLFNSTLSTNVVLGCMDIQSASFDYMATLNRGAACFYTESDVAYYFLAMNTGQWFYFLIAAFANLWLFMTFLGAVSYQVRVGKLMDKAASPVDLPRVAVFIPCYMPNEAPIIMETLQHMTSSEYDGELDFYVVYNTPIDMDIEKDLAKLKRMNGRKVHCQRVPGSRSKADNLEYGLLNYTEKGSICVLFDADHHPRANTIRGLVSILLQSPDLVAVQGAVLIERNGPWILRRLLDGMEWSSWSFYAPGFAEIVGSAYFGGGNAAWRVETLHSLGFDGTMLTEDIDISVRALASGYKMGMAPFLQVGEMCPINLRALYKQRLRWAMGWEQVTLQRVSGLFSSPHISEPRKWRTMMLLVSRYITLVSSAMGVFNLLKYYFFNFYVPKPCEWMALGSVIVTMLIIAAMTLVLFRHKEPWQRWVSVYAFMAVALFYFFIQITLIIISQFRLTCCAGRAMVWVPTSRGKGSSTAPPPTIKSK